MANEKSKTRRPKFTDDADVMAAILGDTTAKKTEKKPAVQNARQQYRIKDTDKSTVQNVRQKCRTKCTAETAVQGAENPAEQPAARPLPFLCKREQKAQRLELRIRPSALAKVKQAAADNNISVNETVNQIIDFYFSQGRPE